MTNTCASPMSDSVQLWKRILSSCVASTSGIAVMLPMVGEGGRGEVTSAASAPAASAPASIRVEIDKLQQIQQQTKRTHAYLVATPESLGNGMKDVSLSTTVGARCTVRR